MRKPRVRYRKGDQITLFEGGRRALYKVSGRSAGAYELEPQLAGKSRVMLDEEITEFRLDGNLEHHPQAPQGLSREQYELLSQDWDMHPDEYRFIAELKADYLRAVDGYRADDHMRLDEACERAAKEVHASERNRWNDSLTVIERDNEADKKRKARLTEDMRDARRGDKQKLARGYLEPKRPTTIQDWWRLWVHVGRSRSILIPLFADRGNRTPRLVGLNGVDLYDEMRKFLKLEYYTDACPHLSTVYKKFKREVLKKTGNEHSVSYNSFNDLRKREFGPYEDMAGREGKRHARMRLDVARRIRYDMKSMQEIEIDHCLLDVLLVHETSGRVLGRPWLTMAMCRSTRMIVGAHLSFDEPSAASVQRCLMHAFWPKDLRGLGLQNEWPAEGIADVVISDNGKDLHSATLRSSQIALKFIMRYLPGRMPWLKGTIERCFGTLQIQVLDLVEGKAFLKVRKKSGYDPNKRATMSLPDLRAMLLRWIVDDYHVTHHSGIDTTPLQRWHEKADPEGQRGVERPDDLLAMLGSAHKLKIGGDGVRMYSQYYWHEELTPLRHEFGAQYEYQCRSDAYDIGRLLLIVPKKRIVAEGEPNDSGRRLELFSTTPERSLGVSVYQNRVRRTLSVKLQREGVPVTDEALDEAINIADAEALSIASDGSAKSTPKSFVRYEQDNGRLLTPVAGRTGSNRPDVSQSSVALPGLSGSMPPTQAPRSAASAPVAADAAPAPQKRVRKKQVKAPPLEATPSLVEDDFEKRFAQMETID